MNNKYSVELVDGSVYISCDYVLPWYGGLEPPIPDSFFEVWFNQHVDQFGSDKRYVFYNVWEPLIPFIPLDSLRGLNCTIIDNETMVWETPRNIEHRPHANHFLAMMIAYSEPVGEECPDSYFSFVNAKYRPSRDKLWKLLEDDGLINEHCSYIHHGIYLRGEEGVDHLSNDAAEFLMRRPPFSKNALIDLAVETEEEWRLRITEKLWKPMYYKRIPLIYSVSGYYETLKGMGFVFHDIMDLSFDTQPDADDRMIALYEEFKKLLSVPLSHLEKITREMRNHNHKVCLERALSTEKPECFYLPSQRGLSAEFDNMIKKAEIQYRKLMNEV